MPKKAKAAGSDLLGAARFGRAKGTLKMGLVGLPNVGKSSLFNLLTEQSAAAENYPFCTIEPTEARCPVPDKRFDKLCSIWKAPSEICAYLMVTDIAGLIKGASQGEGLGNAFLSNIGACDGIYHVVRAFDNDEILHVEDTVDPVRDMEIIHAELCKKDEQFINKAVEAEAEQVKKKRSSSYKTPESFTSAMAKCQEMLAKGAPLRDGEFASDEIEQINEHCRNQLLTVKPVIYVVNLSEKDIVRKKNKCAEAAGRRAHAPARQFRGMGGGGGGGLGGGGGGGLGGCLGSK
jgi:obg-like ATPase 1